MDGDEPATGVDEGEIEMDGEGQPEPDLATDLATTTDDALKGNVVVPSGAAAPGAVAPATP